MRKMLFKYKSKAEYCGVIMKSNPMIAALMAALLAGCSKPEPAGFDMSAVLAGIAEEPGGRNP
ncbi:MAG: hypothetical protein AAF492_02715, partial [Verrucomicrobiota bacterium]